MALSVADISAVVARFGATQNMPPPGTITIGDIGAVVAPEALVKLFVTADVTERARRRADQATTQGEGTDYVTVLADLRRRDRRDATRAVAPLTRAEDAHLLDTTGMDIETAFRTAVDIVNRALAERD